MVIPIYALNSSAHGGAKSNPKRKGRPMVKGRKKRKATRRKSTYRAKRKVVKRKRRNPWYNDRAGHARAARKGWRNRRRRKSAITAAQRTYRKTYSRRRAAARRNPSPRSIVKTLTSQAWLTNVATIGASIAGGLVLMPVITRLMPSNMRSDARKYVGALNIALGATIASMLKGKTAKQLGAIIAGIGAYDLLAKNVPALGLPVVEADILVEKLFPESAQDAVSASYGTPVLPVSKVASGNAAPMGLSYVPGMSASYQNAVSPQTQGLPNLMGSYSDAQYGAYEDDPYSGIF